MNAIPSYATNTITNEGTLVIGEGVTITNDSDGGASYAVDNKGKMILNGGTLIGNRCALRIAKFNQDNVEFVMNSGLVKAATPAWIHLPGSSASAAPTITVTINGGEFLGGTLSIGSGNYGDVPALTINGGTFEYDVLQWTADDTSVVVHNK